MMKAYISEERKRLMEQEWDNYKKAVAVVLKRITPEEFRFLRDEGYSGLIIQKANKKSDNIAGTLGLPLTEIAKLYRLDYLFDLYKEVQELNSVIYRDFLFEDDLSPDEKSASSFILRQSRIEFSKVQGTLVKRAEKIADELNRLQKDLKEQGATSLPIGRIVSVSRDNTASVNVPFILQATSR